MSFPISLYGSTLIDNLAREAKPENRDALRSYLSALEAGANEAKTLRHALSEKQSFIKNMLPRLEALEAKFRALPPEPERPPCRDRDRTCEVLLSINPALHDEKTMRTLNVAAASIRLHRGASYYKTIELGCALTQIMHRPNLSPEFRSLIADAIYHLSENSIDPNAD